MTTIDGRTQQLEGCGDVALFCFFEKKVKYMTDFRFLDYDKKVMDEADLDKYCGFIEDFLQKQQNAYIEFIKKAEEHIKYVRRCEKNGNYYITYETYESEGEYCIQLYKAYGDGSTKGEFYSLKSEEERETKLQELKDQYDSVEWKL